MRQFPRPKIHPLLMKLAYRFFDVEASAEAAFPDSRLVEYSFVIGRLGGMKPGKVLDVGCTARLNYLPGAFADLGWIVWGIDLREFKLRHPNFEFVKGNITHTNFPDNFFDAVYAVSTIEHLGLRGRYGISERDLEADKKAVEEIARILRPGGCFLVTLPVGKKYRIEHPMRKIYDEESLKRLFSTRFRIKNKMYYAQNSEGFWIRTDTCEEDYREMVALSELVPAKNLSPP